MLIYSLAYSPILKMKAKICSEISVDFALTTRCYIPQERTFQNRRCENFKWFVTKISGLYFTEFSAQRTVSLGKVCTTKILGVYTFNLLLLHVCQKCRSFQAITNFLLCYFWHGMLCKLKTNVTNASVESATYIFKTLVNHAQTNPSRTLRLNTNF